jgi:L-seryl-tRNA(Ser) seleniumtransferase
LRRNDNLFVRLPQVHQLLEREAAASLAARYGRNSVVRGLRETLAELREQIGTRELVSVPDADAIIASCSQRLARSRRPGLRRVINATGIVLHTNLGRAPLAAEAIEALTMVAAGYCNVEFDLPGGTRGSRTQAIEPLLQELTGAEAALAVNNGAAAILLALSGLAKGGEVVVSRGELVEIGGGFRIPDVIRQGGARLIEVGSTNKTRVEDYRDAIGPETRALLKVHQSNFRTIGFTAEAAIGELAPLARDRGLLLIADLGSGLVREMPGGVEPSLGEALAMGADLVTCSGDKLLGGPQAGLILGSKAAVDPLRRHPLLRAVRLDKLSLAALEATLMLHRDQPERIPVHRMLDQSLGRLAERAERLRSALGAGAVEATDAFSGGGSLPEQRLESRALVLALTIDPAATAARLRLGNPAVVGRIARNKLIIDMLTVADEELDDLAAALRRAIE